MTNDKLSSFGSESRVALDRQNFADPTVSCHLGVTTYPRRAPIFSPRDLKVTLDRERTNTKLAQAKLDFLVAA